MMISVVFADDAKPMRDKIRAELARYPGGCNILAECEDGHSAVEATLKFNPDITLLDVVMSPMGGCEAADILESSGHKYLLLTSMGQYGVIGSRRNLIKPYSTHLMYTTIRSIIGSE
jgi:DNA-binding NarL/FixJ family response regulator